MNEPTVVARSGDILGVVEGEDRVFYFCVPDTNPPQTRRLPSGINIGIKTLDDNKSYSLIDGGDTPTMFMQNIDGITRSADMNKVFAPGRRFQITY